MASLFWNNLDSIRKRVGKERKSIENECNLPNNAFTQGIRRSSSPSVDLAYKLAKTVEASVEELVDNETGSEYIRKLVKNDPMAIRVPDRIQSIVFDLLLLNENELIGIRANIAALAESKKGKKAAG